jgi:hypothetical protein
MDNGPFERRAIKRRRESRGGKTPRLRAKNLGITLVWPPPRAATK